MHKTRERGTAIAMTLRSQVIERPDANTKTSSTKWNQETQQLDCPATKTQVMFLRGLCDRLGVEYVRPKTKREASRAIDKLLHLQKNAAERRKRQQKRRRLNQRKPRAVLATTDWRFGAGQTAGQEGREIKTALRAGLTDEYEAARARARAIPEASA